MMRWTTAMLLMLCAATAQSQNFWERTEPYASIINKMYFGGGDSIYGTLNSGFTRSTNNGTTWYGTIVVNYVTDMAVAPNGTIFLSQNQTKMSRSTNKGASFTAIGTGITQTSCNAVLTTASGTVLAATSGGIYRSTNNGDAFTKAAGGTELGADTSVVSFARTGNTLFATTNSNGVNPTKAFLLRSTDDGVTWTKGSASLDSVPVYKIIAMANGMIVGRTNNGVRATTDQGNSWSAIGFYGQYIYDIAEGPGNALVVSVSNKDVSAIYRTTNNGQNWNTISAPGYAGATLAVNPSGHLFLGRDQIYRSTDNGTTWKGLPLGFPNVSAMSEAPNGSLYLIGGGSAYQNLYRSNDGGNSWSYLNTKVVGVPSVAFYGDTLIVGDNYYNGTLFRSTDNGATFQSINSPTGLNGYVNAIIGTKYQSLIAGTSNGIYRSVDHGKNWKSVSTNAVTFLKQLPNGTMFGFRPTFGTYVLRSLDSGSTWTEVKTGMTATTVYSLAFAPNGDMFAGTDGILYRSTNAGDAWVRIDTQKVKPYGIYITSNRDGVLFFGGAKSGINNTVYRSTDNGISWTQVNNNITTTDNQANIKMLFAHNGGKLFAGTTVGLYRSVESTNGVERRGLSVPSSVDLQQNFPNPFNPSTTIGFSLPAEGRATITVYDVIGREVARPLDEVKSAGSYTLSFDASHLASGVYYYSLRTGSTVRTKSMLLVR